MRGWPSSLVLMLPALFLLAACAVDPGGLPGDGAVSTECEGDPSVCNDGVDCTEDSCASGLCVNTPLDSRCSASEACFADVGCQPASACDATDCGNALRNPVTCQVGACQADGTCVGESGCAAGESCCGDGSCLDCNDNNPCTADSCAAGGCVNEPLTGTACDNGTFCDGTETCDAGACVSSGDPCAAPTVCEGDRCIGCRNVNDCPDPIMPPYGSCRFGGDTCAESGTQSRTVTTFDCVAEECVGTDANDARNCTRDTDGNGCGTDMVTSWTSCGGFGGTCDQTGTRSRDRTVFQCAAGSCDSSITTETGACSRNTDGVMCGATSTGDWGACSGFSNTCDESGSQSRTVTTRSCSGGSCGTSMMDEMQSCMRDTDGTMCGATQTVMGDCTKTIAADPCDRTGTRTVTTTIQQCSTGSCTPMVSMMTESCMVVTDGDACGGGGPCGGACSAGSCDMSANDGASCDDGLTCTDTDTCSGGVCSGADLCGGSDCAGCGGGSCDCVESGATDACGCV